MFYGPEMTGGGNLPGPLYYVLLSIGLFFKKNWISAWVILYLFTFSAAVSGFYFFKKKSLFSALIWVVLLATAPLSAWFVKLFLNVSYLLPFTVGSFAAINLAFTANEERSRKKYFYLASVLIGAGLQFHFSLIFLWLALMFMICFNSKLKLPGFSFKTISIGIFLFLVPSLPHLFWLACLKMGINFGKPAFYSGEAGKALPSILFLIKSSLDIPWEKIVASWTNKFFFTVPFSLIPFFFLKKDENYDPALRVIIICLIFSFIPYFNWYLSPQANRYTILFFIGLNFLCAFKVHKLIESGSSFSRFTKAAALTLLLAWIYLLKFIPMSEIPKTLLVNSALLVSCYFFVSKILKRDRIALSLSLILALAHVQKLTFPETLFYTKTVEGYMPSYRDWKNIFSVIQKETGWDSETIRKRTYFVGHHVNQDPILFSEAMQKPSASASSNPDGFIISNRYRVKMMKISPEKWLLKQNLHKDILKAIESGELQVEKNLSDRILIAPYYVKKENFVPRHFHNVGEGYQISDDDLILEQIKSNEGTAKLDSTTWLFKWNECVDHHPFCSAGAVVSVLPHQIKVKILGAALSQITPWVSPNFTQSWIEPYLELKCGAESIRFNISSSIGFTRMYSHSSKTFFFAGNNSLIAPFEKTFDYQCKKSLEYLTLGRQKSKIEMIVNTIELPGKTLSVKL